MEKSDSLVRLTRIQALAQEAFQDVEKANTWLRTPLGELSNEKPLAIAQTEAGARVVEQILVKIDWGAAA